jgi:hypothetical protein
VRLAQLRGDNLPVNCSSPGQLRIDEGKAMTEKKVAQIAVCMASFAAGTGGR